MPQQVLVDCLLPTGVIIQVNTGVMSLIRTPSTVGVNNIHLLPSLEGDTKICPTQKIHVARGRSPRET